MGKGRQRNVAKLGTHTSTDPTPGKNKEIPVPLPTTQLFWKWLYHEREGLLWIFGCALLGSLLGFGIGTGHLTGSAADAPLSAWRIALASRIRSGQPYQYVQRLRFTSFGTRTQDDQEILDITNNPVHPRIFAILREAIIREQDGYVHPDLGFLLPAPCGAARGIGMVSNAYHECQTRCFPGIAAEKEALMGMETPEYVSDTDDPIYKQEEVLIRLPLSYQMTRQGALATLTSLFPADVLERAPLENLDDAALLVLYLAHERGLDRASKWLPYISSLPIEPSCGYSEFLRPQLLDALEAMSDHLGLDMEGWAKELAKAAQYANSITAALVKDYGIHLKTPRGIPLSENLEWALCSVASRATAGSEKHGSLRLLPLLDVINHDVTSGGFVELTGTERRDEGDFLDATEQDSGTFVVRALRHGRRRALKVGQELTVNYNVPHFTPLDWFVSLGFVPPERWGAWVKIDPVLPRVRKNGPFNPEEESNNNEWIKVNK